MKQTLSALNTDLDKARTLDQFNAIVNTPPPAEWVKTLRVPYLPIDKVETLLDRIFQQWRVEVISYAQLFQSVSCHVRLHYHHPVTGEWMFHDGLGAVGVQTNAGATAADLSAIKSDAVMKALPAAKSYAIKDAAEHIGKIFGRDLTRKDTVEFTPAYDTERQRLVDHIGLGTMTRQDFLATHGLAKYHNDIEILNLFTNE